MPKNTKKYRIKKIKEETDEDNSVFTGKYARSPRRERTPEEKKEYKRLALFLVGWVALVASVYFAFVKLENEAMMSAVMLSYLILGAVFFLLWVVFNGGVKKNDVTKYEKPDEMGYDEFCVFIEKLKERQRKAKYFLILFMPFIMVMLVDYLIIIWNPEPVAPLHLPEAADIITNLINYLI